MSIDIQKLKALAEAAPTGPWYPPDETSQKGMIFDCDLGSLLRYESIDTERDTCVAYVAAANPAAVLELIAEIERMRQSLLDFNLERDQLKSDNDSLRQQLAVPSDVLADCEAMRLENEKLRKDAGRYRFIRSSNSAGKVDICVMHIRWGSGENGKEIICDNECDNRIDAAMNKDSTHD